jgi:hypothetical protein
MRPLYESSKDLENEQSVAAALSQAWGCSLNKLPMSYHVDWVLESEGKLCAFAELKCRNNPRSKYPTLMLSLNKWVRGCELAKYSGVPFILVVRWSDGLFWIKHTDTPITTGIGGRHDRNDKQDIEPVVYINTEHFKEVKL